MKRISLLLAAGLLASAVVISSCKKDEEPAAELPEVTTSSTGSITINSASCGGNVVSDGGASVTERGICWSTSSQPTTSNNKLASGSGTGSFNGSMNGLAPNTTYYVRAYATNSAGTAYGSQKAFKTYTGTVTDFDGNTYYTITIGSQIWMAENLKVTHYRNGDPIPMVTGNSDWAALTSGAYCDYANTASNSATYGRLYNWYAVSDARKIAPTGWHVPSLAEINALITAIGGTTVAGGKLKSTGTTYWDSPNTGASNDYMFSAHGGGNRSFLGVFDWKGRVGSWWASTGGSAIGDNLYLFNNNADASVGADQKAAGLSVRCIKD